MANCIETYIPHLTDDFKKLIAGGMSEREAGIKLAIKEYQLLFKDLNKFKTSLGIKLTKEQKTYVDPTSLKDSTNKFDIEEIITGLSAVSEKTPKPTIPQISNPTLQVAGITGGHAVKKFNEKGDPVWGTPLTNIPGLNLNGNLLVGGRFELSINGTIQVAGEEYSINSGDVVIVDSDNNVHPMRARNINEDEINTVLYLLSLRAGTTQATETIKISPPDGIKFGNNIVKNVPVFFNESRDKKKSRQNLIETLISFGSKNGGKGEIYFNAESVVTGDPLLVWTDFTGKTHNIQVSKIKTAVDSKNFDELKELVVFLSQKRFNINEHLLGTSDKTKNPMFNKPNMVYKIDEKGQRVADLEWNNTRSYYDHLLKDVLTTTTSKITGYPNRVQRNLFFNKQPVAEKLDMSQFSFIEDTPSTTGLVEMGKGMANDLGKSMMKADVESKGRFFIDFKGATQSQIKNIRDDAQDLVDLEGYEMLILNTDRHTLTLTKKG